MIKIDNFLEAFTLKINDEKIISEVNKRAKGFQEKGISDGLSKDEMHDKNLFNLFQKMVQKSKTADDLAPLDKYLEDDKKKAFEERIKGIKK